MYGKSTSITKRASIIDVTPEETSTEVEIKQSALSPVEKDTASIDPKLINAGKKVFKKCKACHAVGEGAKNKSGPQLYEIIGRKMGTANRYKYSKGFKVAAEEGRIWTEELMVEFLRKPKKFIKGTKMSFGGLKKDKDLNAIVAYLKTQDN
jgi:cytochrome c2